MRTKLIPNFIPDLTIHFKIKMTDTSKSLGTAPILSLLAKYCIPSVLAMLVQVLYTFVDSIFIGHFIGHHGLAAITLVFPILVFSSGFGMLVGVGACSSISLLLGQRRLEEAEKTLGNAFSLIFLISSIMTITLLTLGTIFVNCSEVVPEVQRMAKTFLWISVSFGILPSLMFGLNNIIRVQGNPKIAMGSIMLGFILNSLFNPLFIGVFKWGVAGSALATSLAQGITTIWILCFLTSSKSLLKLKWKNMPLNWKICGPILSIGLAPFLAQSASSLQGLFLNLQLEHYGQEVALTISGIIYRIALIIFVVVLGLYQGAQPILGFNYGARQFARVLKTWRLVILISSIWCFLTVGLIILFPLRTMAFFTDLTPEISEICVLAIRASLFMCFLMGFQVCVSQYFQTIGKPKLSIFLSLTRQVIFMIPAIFTLPIIFGHLGFQPLSGIWFSYVISDMLAFSLAAFFFFRESRLLKTGKISSKVPQMELDNEPWGIN